MSSTSAQKKIASALNQAVNMSLRGASPNDAVIKAAMENDLTPEMTCRVVEAFNIAQTRAFLKVASDKTASFPVANKSDILKAVFVNGPLHPTTEKKEASASYPDVWEPAPRIRVTVSEEHQKSAMWTDSPKPVESSRDIADLMEQVKAQRGVRKVAMEELRVAQTEAYDTFLENMGNLCGAFKGRDANEKFAEFEAEAYAEFGLEAEPILAFVHKHAGLTCDRLSPAPYVGKIYDELEFLPQLTNLESALAARSIHWDTKQKIAALTEVHDQQQKTIQKLMGKVAHGASYVTPATSLVRKKSAASSSATSPVAAAKDLLKRVPMVNPLENLDAMRGSDQDAVKKEYGNAAVEALKKQRSAGMGQKEYDEISNLRRQVILQDLLLNDDILSQQDPRLVIGAYNSLLRMNPTATLVPEVTRSVLRNAISSQTIDPFTAEQLTKLEERMRPIMTGREVPSEPKKS